MDFAATFKRKAPGLLVAVGLLLGMGCAAQQAVSRDRPAGEKPTEPPKPVVLLRSNTLQLTPDVATELDPTMEFRLGIEKEADSGFPNLRARRLTVFVNQGSIDNRGVHTLETLSGSRLISLSKVVILEDGTEPTATLQEWKDANTVSTVYTLGPEEFTPTDEMFRHSDAVVWDVALSGPRDSLETAALCAALEKASMSLTPFIILDRPTQMSEAFIEGPPGDADLAQGRRAYFPLVPFPGMTSGELARYVDEQYGLHASLTVVPMENWSRSDNNLWLANAPTWEVTEAGLRNLRELQGNPGYRSGTVELAAVKSLLDVPLFSESKWSIGEDGRARLQLKPAEIEPSELYTRLQQRPYSGVEIAPVPPPEESETPTAVVLIATGEGQIHPVETAMYLWAAALSNPRNFPREHADRVFASRTISQGLGRGLNPDQTKRRWMVSTPYQNFLAERERALLYQP